MVVTEKIAEYVRELPDSLQAEVLDFVEYLVLKTERKKSLQDEIDWRELSVKLAMRGMENESAPSYTTADLKEKLS